MKKYILLLPTLILSTQNSFFAQEANKAQCESVRDLLMKDFSSFKAHDENERKLILLEECLNGNKIPTVDDMNKLLNNTSTVCRLVEQAERDTGLTTKRKKKSLLRGILRTISELVLQKFFGNNPILEKNFKELEEADIEAMKLKAYGPEKQEWFEASRSNNNSAQLKTLRRQKFIKHLPWYVQERLEILLMREASN